MNAQEFHPDQAPGSSSRHHSVAGVQSAILVAGSLHPGHLGQVLDDSRAERPGVLLDQGLEPADFALLGKPASEKLRTAHPQVPGRVHPKAQLRYFGSGSDFEGTLEAVQRSLCYHRLSSDRTGSSAAVQLAGAYSPAQLAERSLCSACSWSSPLVVFDSVACRRSSFEDCWPEPPEPPDTVPLLAAFTSLAPPELVAAAQAGQARAYSVDCDAIILRDAVVAFVVAARAGSDSVADWISLLGQSALSAGRLVDLSHFFCSGLVAPSYWFADGADGAASWRCGAADDLLINCQALRSSEIVVSLIPRYLHQRSASMALHDP